jgi:general L-amino acid transport system permease protein
VSDLADHPPDRGRRGLPYAVAMPAQWLRDNLFNTWFNSILTILILWGLWQLIPPILDWLVWDSVVAVGADAGEAAAACRQADGACWAFIQEWHRFLLFGRFPFDEQWRPATAAFLFVALLSATVSQPGMKAWPWVPLGATGLVGALFAAAGVLGLAAPFAPGGSLLSGETLIGPAALALLAGLVWLTRAAMTRRVGWALWLAGLWPATVLAIGGLMFGGVYGMALVRTTEWGGLPLTLGLAVIGLAAAFPIGILLALGRRSSLPAVRMMSVAYIELIRGVPLITVLFMASVLFPLFLPQGVTINNLLRAQIGIILFAAAYLAEVVRGGLQSLPRGQYEAADSLGLTYWQTTRLIVLPQALRISIPPLVNTFIGVFKDTSLVIIIGLIDLLAAAKQALTNPEWRGFYREAYLFIAVIYFVFCFSMSRYSQWLEKRVNVGTRR